MTTPSSSKLRVVALNEALERGFWAHVNQDPLDFHFFIFDWKFKREQTQIFLALGEADSVAGLMVIYNGCIVQVRGTREAVRLLLDEIDVEEVAVQAPLDCEDVAAGRFPVFEQKATVMLLSLKKGEENIKVTTEPEKLSVDDADEIAELMREAYPEFWSVITAEGIKESFAEASWVGIRHKGKLVAFGKAVSTPPVSHVAWVATHADYRNRGYATSILSALLKELFESSKTAFIYVLSDNSSAMQVYSAVGFKPYKRYFYVKT
ncbi:GNAT family N-acetyltransferase [Candidatus Bathyarchaeota archaeon]|nr:GNAT family N-acetyltransferase [Candidatus Bathyarchaeota archaeon]